TVTTARAENGGPSGDFDISITAIAAGIVHSTTAHLRVQDFVVSLSPSAISGLCHTDYTGHDRLNTKMEPVVKAKIKGMNGYSGMVHFPVPQASPSFTWTSGTSTPIVPANGGTATLGVGAKLDANACNTPALLYNITWNPFAEGTPITHAAVGQLYVNQFVEQ